MSAVQRPTLPGKAEGIVGLDPIEIQCRGCGAVDNPDTLRIARDHPRAVALVILLSSIHFHARPWTTGHTDNPRLCKQCRQARGCRCEACSYERRG